MNTTKDLFSKIEIATLFNYRHRLALSSGLISVVLLSPTPVEAYTYEDLFKAGTDVVESVFSEYGFGPLPIVSSGSPQWIESEGASGRPLMMLARMLDGNVNMDVSVDGTDVTFYLSPAGWRNRIEGKDRIAQYFVSAQTFGYIIPANFTGSGYKHFVTPSTLTDGAWFMKGTLSENDMEGYHLDMPAPFLVYIFDSRTGSLISKYKHHGFAMDTYRSNATLAGIYTDLLRPAYQEDGVYRARFELHSDGSLECINWGNLGMATTGDGSEGDYITGKWKGNWSLADNLINVAPAQAGWVACDSATVILPQYIGKLSHGEQQPVAGTITAMTNMRHNNPDTDRAQSRWISDGGTCRTYADLTVTFEPMQLFAPGISKYHPQCVDDVVRLYPATEAIISDVDITGGNAVINISAFRTLQTHQFGPPVYLAIEGDLTIPQSAAHVESYELCIIPGYHNDVGSEDFSHPAGHTLAYTTGIISDSDLQQTLSKTVVEDTENGGSVKIPFSHVITLADLPAQDTDGKYSLFVRTNFTPESGLTPTYQALTQPPIPTGVTALTTDGSYLPAEYFTLDGRKITTSRKGALPDETSAFSSGRGHHIIIRRQGTKSSKVLLP